MSRTWDAQITSVQESYKFREVVCVFVEFPNTIHISKEKKALETAGEQATAVVERPCSSAPPRLLIREFQGARGFFVIDATDCGAIFSAVLARDQPG